MSIASHIAENITWQIQRLRDELGSPVTFDGVTYYVITEVVSGAQVGSNELPTESLGAYIASADPRVFRFSPRYFLPTTDVVPPKEGDTLTWHNLLYRVTRVTYDDSADDTHAIAVYAYRQVI